MAASNITPQPHLSSRRSTNSHSINECTKKKMRSTKTLPTAFDYCMSSLFLSATCRCPLHTFRELLSSMYHSIRIGLQNRLTTFILAVYRSANSIHLQFFLLLCYPARSAFTGHLMLLPFVLPPFLTPSLWR